MSRSAVKIIQELGERFPDGLYICRGQSKPFHEDNLHVRSTLARILFEGQGTDLAALEKRVLFGAIPFYAPHTLDIEIMAHLRHFHGPVNFIDFTRNPLIALFFACYGNDCEPGTLFFLPIERGKLASAQDYDRSTLLRWSQPGDIGIFQDFHTESNAKRAVRQSSVLVHSPPGYIDFKKEETYSIPGACKQDMLNYLDKQCQSSISLPHLFHDIAGFIALGLEPKAKSLKDFDRELSDLLLYRAKLLQQDGSNYSKAKEHFFRGDYEEAAIHLQATLKKQGPANLGIEFHRFLSSTLLRAEWYQGALDALARIPKENWTDEEHFVAALSKKELGNVSGALTNINNAIASNYFRSNYYITMMQIAEEAGMSDDLLSTKLKHKELFLSKHGKDSPLGLD